MYISFFFANLIDIPIFNTFSWFFFVRNSSFRCLSLSLIGHLWFVSIKSSNWKEMVREVFVDLDLKTNILTTKENCNPSKFQNTCNKNYFKKTNFRTKNPINLFGKLKFLKQFTKKWYFLQNFRSWFLILIHSAKKEITFWRKH